MLESTDAALTWYVTKLGDGTDEDQLRATSILNAIQGDKEKSVLSLQKGSISRMLPQEQAIEWDQVVAGKPCKPRDIRGNDENKSRKR